MSLSQKQYEEIARDFEKGWSKQRLDKAKFTWGPGAKNKDLTSIINQAKSQATPIKGYTDAIIDYFNTRDKIECLCEKDAEKLNAYKRDESTIIPDFMRIKNVNKDDAAFILEYLCQYNPDNLRDRQNNGPTLYDMCKAAIDYDVSLDGYIVSKVRSDERISFDTINFSINIGINNPKHIMSELEMKAYLYVHWLCDNALDAYLEPDDITVYADNNQDNSSKMIYTHISMWWD